jgi:hypothetical protein
MGPFSPQVKAKIPNGWLWFQSLVTTAGGFSGYVRDWVCKARNKSVQRGKWSG